MEKPAAWTSSCESDCSDNVHSGIKFRNKPRMEEDFDGKNIMI